MTDDARGVEDADADAVRCTVAQFRARFEADNAETLPALRCQHAKSHGCVTADFIVAHGLPGDLRKGIFAREGARYQALLRFSSASSRPKPDRKRDAQGVAIKVFVPVEGEDRTVTQDFILSNHPVFPIRDAIDYCPFSELLAAKSGRARKFLRLVLPPKSHIREFVLLARAKFKRPPPSPLTSRYWSQTPYKLGDEAVVKYFARPVLPSLAARLLSRDNPLVARYANLRALLIGSPERNHALEDAMAQQLSPGAPPARFEFQVQLYQDPDATPIEDPRREWKERDSPFHTVATIEIAAQEEFTSQRRRNAAEALTFTPKHALPEHEPVGAINRVRVEVYDDLSERRHKINGVDGSEPRSREEWLRSGAARVPP
jgi:Catalase